MGVHGRTGRALGGPSRQGEPAHPDLAPQEGRPWVLPLVLFLLSFLFRFHFRNAGLFHHDEVLLAQAVERSLEQGRLVGTVYGRYGAVLLNLIVYAPYTWLTGHSAERVLVFNAILSGGVLAAVLYKLVLEWSHDRAAALMASLFFSFNLLFLTTSTIGKEHTHQVHFVTLGFYLFQRGLRLASAVGRGLGAACFAFAPTLHESTLPLVPAFAAYIVLASRGPRVPGRRPFRDLAVFVLLLAIPLALYLGGVVRHVINEQDMSTSTFLGLASPILPRALGDLATATGVVLAGLALVGLATAIRRWRLSVPLILWLLTILYYGNASGYAPRLLVLIILPICILGGMGGAFLVARIRRPALRVLAGLALVAAVCGYGIGKAYPLLQYRKHYCGPKEMARFVKDRTEPDAIIITMDEFVYIRYYAGREVLTHPYDDVAENQAFVDEAHAIARCGRKLYVTTSALAGDGHGAFRRHMKASFRFQYLGQVADEEYHRPELGLTGFSNQLFRIEPR